MTITAYGTGAYRSATPNSFATSRGQLSDLERQLATQKRAESYGDLGMDRRTSLDLNAKIATLDSWLSGIKLADVNLKLSTQAVENFAKMTAETLNDTRSNTYVESSTGRTGAQVLAEEKFKQTLDLLNSAVNGRYLFSGTASDVQPVESFDTIMNGDGVRAGLKTLIAERQAADGVGGTGRLTTGGAAAIATVTREDVNDAYGFALSTPPALSSSAAMVVTPLAAPDGFSVEVAAQPAAGDTLRFTLSLPDGTTEEVVLTARAPGTTGDPATSFEIGADIDATAASLRSSIGAAIGQEAATTLRAASASWTADDFFNYANDPVPANRQPHRVPASLLDPMEPATPAGTVFWYKGESSDLRARETATVQVDKGQIVGTGARANEEAFAVGLAQFAVMSLETFPAGDPNSQAAYEAMTARVSDKLGFGGGVQKPAEIITELGSAQTALSRAKERHDGTKAYLTTALADVENVTTEEVAVQLLALQTRLQASYQTTAILSQLTLTNYLR